MKYLNCALRRDQGMVALFTRAWIEILKIMLISINIRVALFTRAWIEIAHIYPMHNAGDMSPSSRGRGLKLLREILEFLKGPSPSSRGRGLKLTLGQITSEISVSPSSRGRGLKLLPPPDIDGYNAVALFTRAWIEIGMLGDYSIFDICRPLHEGVD